MEKLNSSTNVYNLIILDESGSMHSICKQALSALNETVEGIRKARKDYPQQHQFVSVITFEGAGMRGVKVRRDRVPVETVENMTPKDYCPGGTTPLYDAMGFAITNLSKVVSEGDAVLVTVITDGEENSSEEYSGRDIRTLVSGLKEKGWTFAYIGANQDAVEVAGDLDITNALNFESTPEGTERMGLKWGMACNRFMEQVQHFLDVRDVAGSSTMGSAENIFEE
ncbi:MAG: VWA domain-containing protein [Candidatus Cryptobacteroides sp.]